MLHPADGLHATASRRADGNPRARRQLSGTEQMQHSAACVHLAFSMAATLAAAGQIALYLAAPGHAVLGAQADGAVRCAAGFFAFRLWTLVHQGCAGTSRRRLGEHGLCQLLC